MRKIDSKVPIIVLTVDECQKIANEFLAAGASDFATKPIKVPDLV
jgi:two-component system response regulator DctR